MQKNSPVAADKNSAASEEYLARGASVGAGALLVQEAGQAMAGIMASIDQVATMMAQIANAKEVLTTMKGLQRPKQ